MQRLRINSSVLIKLNHLFLIKRTGEYWNICHILNIPLIMHLLVPTLTSTYVLLQKFKSSSRRCSTSASSRPSLRSSSLLRHHPSTGERLFFTHAGVFYSAYCQHNEHQPVAAPGLTLLDVVQLCGRARSQRSCIGLAAPFTVTQCALLCAAGGVG